MFLGVCMDQLDLQTFMAIIHTGSLSGAAKTLFTSQAVITHRLRSLENELGFQLISRRQGIRSIELTQYGERFVPLAEHWLSIWDSAKVLGESKYLIPLNIGGNNRLNTYILPPFYSAYSESNKDVILQIKNYHSSDIIDMVSNKQLDLGFISIGPNVKDLNVIPFLVEPLVFICRKNSTYKNEIISPESLDPHNEVQMIDNGIIHFWRNQHWDNNIQPYVRSDSFSMVANYLTHPDLWAICPLQIAKGLAVRNNLEIHPFSVEVPTQTSYIIYRKSPVADHTHELNSFINKFKEFCTVFGDSSPLATQAPPFQ